MIGRRHDDGEATGTRVHLARDWQAGEPDIDRGSDCPNLAALGEGLPAVNVVSAERRATKPMHIGRISRDMCVAEAP